jgi:hypothetical protein
MVHIWAVVWEVEKVGMRRFQNISLSLFLLLPLMVQAQTDVSLFYKKAEQKQLVSVESESGNLYKKLGHHGPAIENPWYALRLYFDKKAAIDVYSKAGERMELREKQWYPSKEEQREGWGADYYKVGKTVGLGGLKLWDKGQLIDLHPVTSRSAEVMQYGDSASMKMISKGIPYKGRKVDICVQVTVYSGQRQAKVSASSLSGDHVQFVTGINFFENLEVIKTGKYIATWGIHPEDVAAEKVEVGAAIFFPSGENYELQEFKNQYILITDLRKSFSFEITSANERETAINSMEDFLKLLD